MTSSIVAWTLPTQPIGVIQQTSGDIYGCGELKAGREEVREHEPQLSVLFSRPGVIGISRRTCTGDALSMNSQPIPPDCLS